MNRTENTSRRAIALGALACLAASAGTANAAITDHRWEVIDNTVYAEGSSAGMASTIPGNVYTFDLYLEDDGGIPVNAFESNVMGSGIENDGIVVSGGTFFQVDVLGSPNNLPPTPGEIDFIPNVQFDSYIAIGPLTDAEILTPDAINFGVAGGTRLSGSWAPNPGGGGGTMIPLDSNNEVFVGRFSIQLDPGVDIEDAVLSGELVAALGNGTTQILSLSNAFDAIPAPGSAALFAVAGVAAARRRRA